MRLTFWLRRLLTQSNQPLHHSSASRRRSRRKLGRAIPQSIARFPEQLEDRTLLTSAISFLNGTLTIDVGADGEQTTLSVSAGELSVTSTDVGGTTADANAQALGFATMTSADMASTGSLNGGSAVTQIVINGASGAQTVILGDGAFPGLTAGGNSDIELITVIGDVTLGNNDLQLLATQTVAINSGSSISTVDGNVTLEGNSAGAATADSVGISLTDAIVSTSGTGNISLTGQGGDGAGAENQGVLLTAGTRIESTSSDASAGTISIIGTGGSGTQSSNGVEVSSGNSSVSTVAGAITIHGTGGSGAGGRNKGVLLSDNVSIESVGTGATAGTIEVSGTGGTGGSSNRGVELFRSGTGISSVDGAVSVTGTGGGVSDLSHIGVGMFQGSRIESTGTGGGAATISIAGVGGTGTSYNRGIAFTGNHSGVSSVDGDIVISGTGGNGTGDYNSGILLMGGGQVVSTGTSSDAATITLTGLAVTGHRFHRGVAITDSNAGVSTVAGDINISGTSGAGTGVGRHGVFVFNGAFVESTGTGGAAGNIQIEGAGGSGSLTSSGVTVMTADAHISAADGSISIVGHDGAVGGATNLGLEVVDAARIESTGSTISVVTDDGVNVDSTSQITSALGTTIDVDLDTDDAGTGGTVTITGTVQSGTQTTITTGSDGDSILYTPPALTGATVINSGGGNDTVSADGAAESVTINGGDGDDSLTGSAFDDVLNGEAGDDTLMGLAGIDELTGGPGFDQLTGGPGVDSFENVARPLIVDTALDVDDGDYSAGNLSLREAVRLANESVDLGETISFDAALNGMTISLTGGELPVLNPVIVNGPGAHLLTIDADNLSRVFNVDDGNSEEQIGVSISGLTLTRGMTAGNGGAIVNSENLTVNDLTITGSSAMYGGGIYNDSVLSVIGSTLSENSAESGGGILDEQATLTVTTSTIADNTATFQGAGIRLGRSTTTITDSAILRNTGAGEGGGISSYQSNLTVHNSTIHGNESRGDGGGIFVGSGGAATVVQSTISGNRSGVDNVGLTLTGGARAPGYELATLAIKNSVDVAADSSGSITFTDNRGSSTEGTDASLGGSLFVQLVDNSPNSNTFVSHISVAPNSDTTIAIELEDGTSGDGVSSFAEIQAAIAANAAAAERISVSDNASAGGFTAAAPQVLTGGVNGERVRLTDRRASATEGAFATLGGTLSIDLNTVGGGTAASAATDGSGNITVTVNMADGATLQDVVNAILADQSMGGAAEFIAIDTVDIGTGTTLVTDSGGPQLFMDGYDGLNSSVSFSDIRQNTGMGRIRVDFNNAGADRSLSVNLASSQDDHDITVTLATDSEGNVTSTAADVAAAVNGHYPTRHLVHAEASGGGSELVADSGGLANGVLSTRSGFIFGGGIRKRSGSLTVHNTIVAGNFRGEHTLADDLSAPVNTGSFNLVGDADTSGGLMNGVNGNIVGNAGSGVLNLTGVLDVAPSNHGGPTDTFALPEGSIAIDAGDNAQAPSANDQRGTGFDRILDGDGNETATVDIGSFEYQPPPPAGPASVTVAIPANLELLVQDGFLIVRDIPGTEYFRELQVAVSQLRIDLSDGTDVLTIPETGSPVTVPVKIYSHGGNDHLDASQATTLVTLVGGSGDDTLEGGTRRDVLNGGGGHDILRGGPGNDLLRGQGGRDSLTGGLDSDTLFAGAGLDVLIETTSAQVVSLGRGGMTLETGNTVRDVEFAVLTGSDESQSIYTKGFPGIVTVNGAGGNDTIDGTDGNDVLNGGDGNDLIVGYGGSDRINGGDGDDNLVGGAGSDTLTGGDGDDRLRGLGSSGDVLSGGPGADRLDGGKGNDRLIESSEAGFILTDTSLDDGTSVDTLVGLESAFLTGGDGGHRLDASGFSGWVRMTGGRGNDTLIGTALGDALNGRGGNDRIEGQDGHDRIRGGAGRDLLFGGNGNDLLLGQGSSGDTLRGGDGTDSLDGGAGTDRIFNDGIDMIFADPRDNIVLL